MPPRTAPSPAPCPDAAATPAAAAAAPVTADAQQVLLASACRKLTKLLCPFALLFSIIASLDRANLSFASLDMTSELGLGPLDYGAGSAIFFVSYSVFQVPSNVCFLFVGGRCMLGAIAVCWGLIAGSMAAVNDRASFLAVRFLLGIAEAGTVPGMWAYMSRMMPHEQLTLPTTFYMAGITAAQALGAPLAAGLLSLHGAGGISGWRWLFIIEGAPAVLLGCAIWAFLPSCPAACQMLSKAEAAALQGALDGTLPRSYPAQLEPPPSALEPCASGALPALSPRASSPSSMASSLSRQASTALAAAAADGEEGALAAAMQRAAAARGPSARELGADLMAALRCRVVWCASSWRFLYLLVLNGLIFWVPLLVDSMMAGPQVPGGAAAAKAPRRADSRTMLLAAVPYIAGVAAHLLNAAHSHAKGERRWHIALPWLWGGVVLLLLPVAWTRGADGASYALLVVASLGIMGCDGVDVSWIISLFRSLSPSQTVLALALVNMIANFGGFVGNYVIGALKQASGNYYGSVWLMGAVMCAAAGLVAAFPLAWADGGGGDGGGAQPGACAAGAGQAGADPLAAPTPAAASSGQRARQSAAGTKNVDAGLRDVEASGA